MPDSYRDTAQGSPNDAVERRACPHDCCSPQCCNVDGLWWGDPEYPPIADTIWRNYVEARHRFEKYTHDTAITLGQIARTVEPHNFPEAGHVG